MKIVEAQGSPHDIGASVGEALAEEIRIHIEWRKSAGYAMDDAWWGNLPAFLGTLKRYSPRLLEEMESTARGAGVPVEEIYFINDPAIRPGDLDCTCTNVAFNGSFGPTLGKNNDGCDPERTRAFFGKLVRPKDGIPLLTFGPCGQIATVDGMNAEGLAAGHSSVGSNFQQSLRHPHIKHWEYVGLLRCRTVKDFLRHMTEMPLRGKGYAMLHIDRQGDMASIEAPCPLLQVRRPRLDNGMQAVNCYQLPALRNADARSPEGKENALARAEMLDEFFGSAPRLDVETMQTLMRRHEYPGLCRHGKQSDGYTAFTELSYIALPAEGKVLYLDGNPCENTYSELSF